MTSWVRWTHLGISGGLQRPSTQKINWGPSIRFPSGSRQAYSTAAPCVGRIWPASNGHRPVAPTRNICMPTGTGGRSQCTKMQRESLTTVLLRGFSTPGRMWTKREFFVGLSLFFVSAGVAFFEPTVVGMYSSLIATCK